MFRIPVLLLCFTLCLSAPASAAPPINDAGEAALRAQIQTLLDRQKHARTLAGGALVTQGDLLIEQADSYYAVTLPDITLTEANGQNTHIGIIAINAIPDDTPGNWKLSLSLPSPITWKNAAGQKLGTLTIGNQNFAGVWDKTLEGFSSVNVTYDTLRVEELTSQTTHLIQKAVVNSTLKETKPDLWSGNAVISLSGISTTSTAHTGRASIDGVTATVNITDLSATKQQQMREKVGAFAENTDPKELENMSPAGQLALFNMMMDIIRSAGSQVGLKVAIKNLKTTMPAVANETAKTLSMKDGLFGIDVSGMDKNTVTLALRAGFDGLLSTPQTADTKDITPSRMDMNIKLLNLPFDELVKVGQDSIKSAGAGPAARQFAGIQAMMVLPQILSQAGAQLSIVDSNLHAPGYDVKLNGAMKADTGAALGGAGTMRAEIIGLDDVLKKLQARAKNADAIEKAKIGKLTQMLTVLSLAGQIEKRGDTVVKIYDFELAKDGTMLLNGSDLSLLTGISPPDAAPTADTPTAR